MAAGGAESDGLAQLHAKYADDSDSCSTETNPTNHETVGTPLSADLQTSSDPSSSKWQQQQQSPERPAEPSREERWSDYDEEEYASSEEEDDEEVYAALEWADDREGHMARGHAPTSFQHNLQQTAGFRPNAALNCNQQQQQAGGRTLQPNQNNMQKLSSRICVRDDVLESLVGVRLSAGVANELKVSSAKAAAARVRAGDKSDRATVEQALDPRTRMVLFKMLNRGVFSEIYGCVSTGKEANVYHACSPEGADLAIKVYKTSILVFKDRDRYVSGDFRFRSGYCRSNPRKMVKTWAEKEMRNLARLRAAGIPAPAPLLLRLHVLVMDFIGEDGVAAPRLKDACLPLVKLCAAYQQLVRIVRQLFQACRLVHADLSEYNILVHKGELVIIDVSQAVDLDHPKAFDFLREDCKHINDFFRRAGVAVLTNRELFDFAVDPNITADNEEAVLQALHDSAASRPLERGAEAEVAEAVFQQAFIPRKLDEVAHYERDRQLDIQSLPSLEKFDSQLLMSLWKDSHAEAGSLGQVMDETLAHDDDTALQQLMLLKQTQQQQKVASMPQGVGMGLVLGPLGTEDDSHSAFAAAAAATTADQQTHSEGVTPRSGSSSAKRRTRGGLMMMEDAVKAEQQQQQQQELEFGFDFSGGAVSGLQGIYREAQLQASLSGLGGIDPQHQQLLQSMSAFAAEEESSQSPSKRARAAACALAAVDSDLEDPSGDSSANLKITSDMDEHTKARIRREKNRVAARKCRAKKMQFMCELQQTLRELMRKNEEYRLQMFSREVRLREAMKRIIAVMWQSAVSPAATGYTANDVIIGLESGTLDINSLLRSLVNLSGNGTLPGSSGPSPLVINSPASMPAGAAAAAAGPGTFGAAGLPGPGTLPPPTPRNQTPHAAAAAAATANGVLGAQLSDGSVGDLAVLPERVGGLGPGGAAAAGGVEGAGHPHSLLMGHPTALPSSAPLPVAMDGLTARLDSDGIAAVSGGACMDGLAVSVGIPGMPDMSAAASGGLEGGWLWADPIVSAPVGAGCSTTSGMQE
eukprot:gene7695-7894_t